MAKMKKIWACLNLIRSIPLILTYYISNQKIIIREDINRWINVLNLEEMNLIMYLNYLLVYYPEFRNLFYYRIKKDKPIISKFLCLFYRPLSTLYIYSPKIGGGLFIQHGFSTIIAANALGRNCWINQQVTIGYKNKTECPTIGDNVTVAAGAKVIGGITINNNVIIGANAVVVKNVPENCTIVGNPSYIIKKDGVKVQEQLK